MEAPPLMGRGSLRTVQRPAAWLLKPHPLLWLGGSSYNRVVTATQKQIQKESLTFQNKITDFFYTKKTILV